MLARPAPPLAPPRGFPSSCCHLAGAGSSEPGAAGSTGRVLPPGRERAGASGPVPWRLQPSPVPQPCTPGGCGHLRLVRIAPSPGGSPRGFPAVTGLGRTRLPFPSPHSPNWKGGGLALGHPGEERAPRRALTRGGFSEGSLRSAQCPWEREIQTPEIFPGCFPENRTPVENRGAPRPPCGAPHPLPGVGFPRGSTGAGSFLWFGPFGAAVAGTRVGGVWSCPRGVQIIKIMP